MYNYLTEHTNVYGITHQEDCLMAQVQHERYSGQLKDLQCPD